MAMLRAALSVAAVIATLPVHAETTIFSTADVMTAASATDQAFAFTLDNATPYSSAMLNFDIIGYASLDGDNYYIDVFGLTLNNTSLLTGTFNMSGGGISRLISNPFGATSATTTYTPQTASCTETNYCGGITHVSVPITLVAGTNVLNFSYSSPTSFDGTGRAGFQSAGDESWRIGALTVAAVPEPETYAMLMAGLGLLVAVVKRRRTPTVDS